MSTDIPIEAMMAKFEADAREHDREVRIATLVQAARATCVMCENGRPIHIDGRTIVHDYEHLGDLQTTYCDAFGVIRLLVEAW